MSGITHRETSQVVAPRPSLSARQRACLGLAAQGLTSAQIARRLSLSPRTVDEHVLLACRALGVRTRIQAVARLTAQGRLAGAERPGLM